MEIHTPLLLNYFITVNDITVNKTTVNIISQLIIQNCLYVGTDKTQPA